MTWHWAVPSYNAFAGRDVDINADGRHIPINVIKEMEAVQRRNNG
jgi:hypothetical protein